MQKHSVVQTVGAAISNFFDVVVFQPAVFVLQIGAAQHTLAKLREPQF
jgi:hypothetical protein